MSRSEQGSEVAHGLAGTALFPSSLISSLRMLSVLWREGSAIPLECPSALLRKSLNGMHFRGTIPLRLLNCNRRTMIVWVTCTPMWPSAVCVLFGASAIPTSLFLQSCLHFKQAHPGQKPGGDTRRLSCIRPLNKDEPALWKCPFCDCGISKQEGGRFGVALIARFKKAHKIEKHAQVTWKCWRRKKYEDADRAERILVTKHNARQTASMRLIEEMRAQDFTAFPWPRLGAKTATLNCSIYVNLSWRCNRCKLPLRSVGEARKHRQNSGQCPSATVDLREPARLRKLQTVRELLQAYPAGFVRERLTNAFSVAEQALRVSGQEV